MTELLKQAFERAQQLPEKLQDTLAARILDAIDEQEWQEISHKFEVQEKLLTLADAVWAEHEAGKTEKGGFAL